LQRARIRVTDQCVDVDAHMVFRLGGFP
jgi:hypothetical protein